jgi:hypothetical protein
VSEYLGHGYTLPTFPTIQWHLSKPHVRLRQRRLAISMEYLEERATRRQLLDRTRGTGQQTFDPNLAILKALCFQFSLESSLQVWF